MKRRLLFMIVAVVLFSGCSSAPTNPIKGNAVIDWVDFVKLGEQTYTGLWNHAIVNPEDVLTDQVAGEVEFKVADVVTNPNYRTKAGDAAFLDIGTELYHVRGFPEQELIAAADESRIGGYRLYAEVNFAKTMRQHYKDVPKEQVERIELFRDLEVVPYQKLFDDEKEKFIQLLESGTDQQDFSPDQSKDDPTYYKMAFYIGEPIAYVYSIADDGSNVFFHPWETRVVDDEIRNFIC